MAEMNLCTVYPKPDLSKPAKNAVKMPYLLKNLKIERPNQVWAVDITYISMKSRLPVNCVRLSEATSTATIQNAHMHRWIIIIQLTCTLLPESSAKYTILKIHFWAAIQTLSRHDKFFISCLDKGDTLQLFLYYKLRLTAVFQP